VINADKRKVWSDKLTTAGCNIRKMRQVFKSGNVNSLNKVKEANKCLHHSLQQGGSSVCNLSRHPCLSENQGKGEADS